MCICCIVVNSSPRFPFVLCSVRDELLTRPTSDVKVHPHSGTACCLDESLPEAQRGSWLAVNHKLGTFSLLTNSSEPTRTEPKKGTVPSRGLLVLSAVETPKGRLSEHKLAVPISWNNNNSNASTNSDTNNNNCHHHQHRQNIFGPSFDAVAPLNGFNLLSGCLVPGEVDVRYTSNVYGKEFDKCLFSSSFQTSENNTTKGWSMSNTFMDNVHEPRLAFLKEKAIKVLDEYFSTSSSPSSAKENKNEEGREQEQEAEKNESQSFSDAKNIVNILGEVLLSRPNFSDEDLPIQHLNLSEENKKNEYEVEIERACQRNIASYCEWTENLMNGNTNNVEVDENGNKKTPQITKKKFDWGTRTHIIVLVEKLGKSSTVDENEGEGDTKTTPDCLIHFFSRSVEIKVDEEGPRHGPAHQPSFEMNAKEWKHLVLPHHHCDHDSN